MESLELITSRQSCRAFKPETIPDAVMEKILKAAGNSPSYTNTQPWEVAVVTGSKRDDLSDLLVKLAKANAPVSPDISIPSQWPSGMLKHSQEHGARRLATLGVARDDKEGREHLRIMNYEFYGAPCALFVFMDGSLGEWSLFDLGVFIQNLVLAAHSLGVDGCIQASVTHYAREIKDFLGIPENKKMTACISMGFRDADAKLNQYRSLKMEPDEFVRWYR